MRAFAEGGGPDLLARRRGGVTSSMQAGGKLLVRGNGGSAADAQHIAGEFISRLMYDRRPLPSVALTTDTSALTATGNDYGLRARLRVAGAGPGRCRETCCSGYRPRAGRPTSCGRSKRQRGSVALSRWGSPASTADRCANCATSCSRAPSDHTPIIQQIHITAAHILCALVERSMSPTGRETG